MIYLVDGTIHLLNNRGQLHGDLYDTNNDTDCEIEGKTWSGSPIHARKVSPEIARSVSRRNVFGVYHNGITLQMES